MSLYIIKNTIKSEYKVILFYILNTVLLVLLFNLKLQEIYILYPVFLSGVFLLCYLLLACNNNNKLKNNMQNNKIANLETPFTTSFMDKLYTELIADLHFDYNRKINNQLEKNKRNEVLFSQFIHNMKTSVSVIEIASTVGLEKAESANETQILEDIQTENTKLKEQLEQSLNILRLDQFSQDYVPEKQDLLEVVKSVVNQNKTNFIYNSVYPKVVGESTFVLSDRKWLTYILNQIISNAIKYNKSGGTVSFVIENKSPKLVSLQIIDTGVGIPQQDIERVFDLFYTGSNGRDNVNSTGVGLAMVKSVAKLLGHDVKLTSELDKGTTVELFFGNM